MGAGVVTRKHRHQINHADTWNAVAAGLRSAMVVHPEIHIPNPASVIKRVVGEVLALDARTGANPVDMADGASKTPDRKPGE